MSVLLRTAASLYAALWLATVAGALAGRLSGDRVAIGERGSGGGALFATVLATNARLVAAVGIGALLVHTVPAWRLPVDTVVAALAAVNALAVGAAVGAGGGRVARALVHLPLEWAVLAGVLALYVGARRDEVCGPVAIRWMAVVLGLVVVAAGVEAWAPELG